MSGLLFHDAPPAASPSPAALPNTGIATGFWENMRAGFRDQMLSSNFISRDKNLFNAYEPIVQALNGEGGRRVFRNPYQPHSFPLSARLDPAAEVQRIWREIARRRKEDPQAAAGLPGSKEALDDQVKEQVLAARREFENISARSTTGGAIGGFVGQTGAAMLDPPVLATLFMGAPASAGILRTALVEMFIGAGTEVGIQPAVAQYYDELGIDYTATDFAANVAMGGAGGAVFGGGVKAAETVLRRAFQKQARGEELTPEEAAEAAAAVAHVAEDRLPELAEDAGVTLTADGHDAARNLTAVSDYEHPLPPGAGQAQRQAHAQKVEQAETILETGPAAGAELPSSEIPARFNPEPVPSTLEALSGPGAPAVTSSALDGGPLLPVLVRAQDIETDASAFQFKSGGDSKGVTDRLANVTRWDDAFANEAIVYEYADGRRVIADGHQRLGLAQRLMAEGRETNIMLKASILREADGAKPEDAFIRAAAKNIAEDSADPVDIAAILRIAPDRLKGVINFSRARVQTAIGLSRLNPEAFGLVTNRLVPDNVAAVVGRLAPDDAPLQTGIMQVFARDNVRDVDEANALARQFIELQGDDEKMADLFGDRVVATSLIREKARLIARVTKDLRDDKRTFRTLSTRRDKIEAAGNTLAEGNEEVAMTAAQVEEIVNRLAYRTGPVSEAFTAGARKAKEQGRYDEAARDVADAIRTAVRAGDIGRIGDSGAGRSLSVDGPDTGASLFADAARGSAARAAAGADAPGSLTGFSEPAGAASQAQSEGLAIDLGEVDDGLEVDLFAGTDGAGNEVTERLTKSAVLERQAAEADFLDQLQVVCRTRSAA